VTEAGDPADFPQAGSRLVLLDDQGVALFRHSCAFLAALASRRSRWRAKAHLLRSG
jgi:hypothetical protein